MKSTSAITDLFAMFPFQVTKGQSEQLQNNGGAMTKRTEPETVIVAERLLTLPEAAEVLRLSTRTVREYVKRGEIKGRIIGKRWRFRRADLDAFFENAPSQWDFDGKHGDGD